VKCSQPRQGETLPWLTATGEITRRVVKRDRRRAKGRTYGFWRERLVLVGFLVVLMTLKRKPQIMSLPSPRSTRALPTFSGYHSGWVTTGGLITSQGETGPQKRREPRYAVVIYYMIYLVLKRCSQSQHQFSCQRFSVFRQNGFHNFVHDLKNN